MSFSLSLECHSGISVGLNDHVSSYAIAIADRCDRFGAVNLLLYDEGGECRILGTKVLLLSKG
jgi:hypothetical protein